MCKDGPANLVVLDEGKYYFSLLLFPVNLIIFLIIIASRHLQKSSANQNISVTLLSVDIAIFVSIYVYLSTLKS